MEDTGSKFRKEKNFICWHESSFELTGFTGNKAVNFAIRGSLKTGCLNLLRTLTSRLCDVWSSTMRAQGEEHFVHTRKGVAYVF
jgi:hypothetical protein